MRPCFLRLLVSSESSTTGRGANIDLGSFFGARSNSHAQRCDFGEVPSGTKRPVDAGWTLYLATEIGRFFKVFTCHYKYTTRRRLGWNVPRTFMFTPRMGHIPLSCSIPHEQLAAIELRSIPRHLTASTCAHASIEA